MSDLLLLALRTLLKLKLRTALSMLGIAIGVASMVLLTSIGEGTRRYILGQFSQFGTNLLAINPGKTETAEETRARLSKMREERRRITRAKAELTRVVQTIPEGKKFNIIAFSTEVVPWKKLLAPVNAATRKEAVEYIASTDGLCPSG